MALIRQRTKINMMKTISFRNKHPDPMLILSSVAQIA
jgi:hypothetical protein